MKERFKVYKGYKYDKVIFRSLLFTICIIALFGWLKSDSLNPFSSSIYVSCPINLNSTCVNPLYQAQLKSQIVINNNIPIELSSLEYLPPGYVYGKENKIIKYFPVVVLFLLIIAFLFNHFMYNKGYDFKKNMGV